MASMSGILETGWHNLRLGATVGPGPDKEQKNAHVLASATTLTFPVVRAVSV